MFSKLLRSLALAAMLCSALTASAVDIVYPGATAHSTGGTFGRSATDKISLYGATTIVQPSGAAQAALTDSTSGSTANATLNAITLTDSTTGAAGATLAAGVGITTISIPIDLASVGNADVISAYVPGYKFKLLKSTFAVNKPVTTGAKLSTLSPKITGVAVTGGVLALTSANCTPMGALVAGSSITAANTGSSSDSITLTGSATTAFVEGSGVWLLEIQNMDSADAVASITAKLATQNDNDAKIAVLVNALRAGLVPTTGIGAIKGAP